MTNYTPQWYPSPIDLPERTVGKVRIRHRTIEVGRTVDVVGMRQALLRGMRPFAGKVKTPLRIHELYHDDHGVWMTDLPEELNQIGELLHDVAPSGSVLIGGLGLGILAHTVAALPEVTDVTVIERDRGVIRLCATGSYRTINSDITKYLRRTKEDFDFYLLDTWQMTNETAWWTSVMPLRRLIRNRWGARHVVHCWAEDIMQAQVRRSLTMKEAHWFYAGLPMPMAERKASSFLHDVGLPTWEKRYGKIVDAALNAT